MERGRSATRRVRSVPLLALLLGGVASACEPPSMKEATPDEIRAFFQQRGQKVITFLGYSGAEYEDPAAMLAQATKTLAEFDPKRTIVNIGATAVGIGAVYEIAKRKGFTTTGIVSTQARDDGVALSTCVDHVFFVRDATWGGLVPGTERLSPTSTAIVDNSDVMVAIGGGEVTRDELVAARRAGKEVRFIPADMNHRIARERAEKKGQPVPTDFRGAVATLL